MILNYFGNASFRLQSGDVSILLDPENNRLKADIILKTLIPASFNAFAEKADAQIIASPGEYEIKGIEINGFSISGESNEENIKIAYAIYWEEMKFVFLGHLAGLLDAVLAEEFANPDVLVLPAGGGVVLEPEVAAKISKQLEARIVIPGFSKDANAFLKAMGKKAEAAVDKFVFKQKDIMNEKGKPIILKAA